MESSRLYNSSGAELDNHDANGSAFSDRVYLPYRDKGEIVATLMVQTLFVTLDFL